MSNVMITVTIGRNVHPDHHYASSQFPESTRNPEAPYVEQVPMRPGNWADFASRVYGLLRCLPDAHVYGPFQGTGEWEGVPEDSITYTVTTSHPTILSDSDVADTFGRLLGDIGQLYGQDAIAWSYGPAMLAR